MLGNARVNFNRIHFLQWFVVVLLIILAATVFYHQYVLGKYYRQLNDKQCLRRIVYPGLRGSILDRGGRVLATQRAIYCLYVDLNYFRKPFETFCKHHKDPAEQQEQLWSLVYDALLRYARQVGPIPLEATPKGVLQHYRQNILLPLPLSHTLTEELYGHLFNQLPSGSPFQVGIEWKRTYPYGATACHVIGYVSSCTDETEALAPGKALRTFFYKREQGRMGIEAGYDGVLKGANGIEIWRVTPGGEKQACVLSLPSTPGNSVRLSLDIELQEVCETALGSRKGSVVVLDIATGGVLAMVSHPGFNLSHLVPTLSQVVFEDINQRGAWLNRATQGLYPMGSIFKPLALSAFLRSGKVQQDTVYTCTGSETVGNRAFHCHDLYGHGPMTPVQALENSCNPFFFHYGVLLGADALHVEAVRYHLDRPSGIDLPYETRALCIPDPKWKLERLGDHWTDGDTANLVIGQGYTLMTPLKVACFAAALAQNRTVFKPHLVKKTAYSYQKALPEADWLLIKEGMVKIGQRYFSFMPLALKSGTAQVKVKGKSEYWHIGWLMGFAPADHPQIAFCVEVEQEQSGTFWGGSTCSPIAGALLRCWFKQ